MPQPGPARSRLFHTTRHRKGRGLVTTLSLALAAGSATFLPGCSNVDSYMDPSVLGRWEYTPTSVPILTHISSIEDRPGDLVEYSSVSAEDLLPNPADYRVGPGDRLAVKINDFYSGGDVTTFDKTIDIRGTVDFPQLGRLYVNGRTVTQVKDLIGEKMKTLVAEPIVEVDITEFRQQIYSIVGGMQRPGAYFVARPDFRLLEAITNGERVQDPTTKDIFVIRLVGLDEALDTPTGGPPSDTFSGAAPGTAPGTPAVPRKGEDLLDVINSIADPSAPPKKPGDKPSPSVLRGNSGRDLNHMPAQPPVPDRTKPAIDLPDATPAKPPPPEGRAAPIPIGEQGAAPWVFVDGKWIQVSAHAPGREPAVSPGENERRPSDIVTQRVIRVPLDRLMAGDSTQNLIIRPGDVIRVPESQRGTFYVGGFVRRPGGFNLPDDGKMTILRAIDAAGGLDSLAVPDRAELIRIVGKDRQAIVSVNLRAIAEFTQPDIYIKPDDRINIGTSFWATPLAVIRNGFRASYGFGFLLDRNFGNDVFGLPPEYQTRARDPLPF